jgi:hypothetical protein
MLIEMDMGVGQTFAIQESKHETQMVVDDVY